MSLINDALSDLETRSGVPNADKQSKLEYSRNRNDLWSAKPIVLSLLFAVFLCAWQYFNKQEKASTVSDLVVAQTIAEQAGDKMAAIDSHETSVKGDDQRDTQSGDSRSSTKTVLVDTTQQNIELWLAEATQAMAELRLSVPQRHSAVFYFNKVIASDADNKVAHAGLNAVKKKYEALTTQSIAKGDVEKAKQLSGRLLGLLDAGELQEYKDLFDRVESLGIASNASPQQSAQTGVAINPSSNQLLNNKIIAAELMLRENRNAKAEALLAPVHEIDEANLRVRALYFDALIEQGKIQHLAANIDDKTYSVDIYYAAKLVEIQHGERAAMLYLREHRVMEERSLSMLAGLLQKHKRYNEAVESYRRLIRMNQNKEQYRLGLAVSLDASGDANEAYLAYLSINDIESLAPALRTFVAKRIQDLGAQVQKLELTQW